MLFVANEGRDLQHVAFFDAVEDFAFHRNRGVAAALVAEVKRGDDQLFAIGSQCHARTQVHAQRHGDESDNAVFGFRDAAQQDATDRFAFFVIDYLDGAAFAALAGAFPVAVGFAFGEFGGGGEADGGERRDGSEFQRGFQGIACVGKKTRRCVSRRPQWVYAA